MKVNELFTTAYNWLCKSRVRRPHNADVWDFRWRWANIRDGIEITKLGEFVRDARIIGFVWKYLNRVVEYNGLFHEVKRGVPMGSSLSPLLGAFYLRGLDLKLAIPGVFYARYMDDILIVTKSRWRLRHAIKILNEEFALLGLTKHPQKTTIGRVEKGFEFLGYHYGRDGLCLAGKTLDNFISKALRLYEQEPVQTRLERLGEYAKRWVRWTTSGLQSLEVKTL
ncbi:MAG: putative reverse transcriptase [Candidatus Brocadiaceae bacterium]|nr:putative reverse transcriptase [Candidatus Brocadiaceae bacterium]